VINACGNQVDEVSVELSYQVSLGNELANELLNPSVDFFDSQVVVLAVCALGSTVVREEIVLIGVGADLLGLLLLFLDLLLFLL